VVVVCSGTLGVGFYESYVIVVLCDCVWLLGCSGTLGVGFYESYVVVVVCDYVWLLYVVEHWVWGSVSLM